MDRWGPSLILWLSCFVFVISTAARAEIYKWVDAQGRVHYSDSPVRDAVPVDDVLPPASIFTLPPEAIPPVAKPSEPVPGAVSPSAPPPSVAAPPAEVAAPPAEGEVADDEAPTDTEETTQGNQPNSSDTPGNIAEEEEPLSPPLTADAPEVSLPPDEAPENQFGPGNEFDAEGGALLRSPL